MDPLINPSLPPQALPLGYYQHLKGGVYRVLGLARDTSSEAWMVYYQCQYGDWSYWVRPLAEFVEPVTRDGQTQARFRFLAEQWPEAPAP